MLQYALACLTNLDLWQTALHRIASNPMGSSMIKIASHRGILTAAGVIIGIATAAIAAPLDALQGAWTMDGTDCSETFKKVGAEVQFKDRTATQTTGIIVSGDRITAPNATCTAGRIREQKEHFSVQLNCADTVMLSSLSMSFKIIDKDNFERFDPEFPDISFTYHKCTF